MPEKELISKANSLGGAISVWFKVIGTVIALIGYGFLTYYQIQSNSVEIHEFKLVVNREFEIWKTRSDKRYDRAMEKAVELTKVQTELEHELEETKTELSFIKGRQYEQDKHK